jgi:hypothetical protein
MGVALDDQEPAAVIKVHADRMDDIRGRREEIDLELCIGGARDVGRGGSCGLGQESGSDERSSDSAGKPTPKMMVPLHEGS